MIDELQMVGQNLFIVFFLTRITQVLVAFFAATALFFKKEILAEVLSLYILFLIAVGACFSIFEPSEMVLRLSINAFFYLLLAASYKGTLKDWAQIYLPVASFLLFVPMGLKASHLFHFQNLYFVIASFLCSNGIVFIRKYVNLGESDAPQDKLPQESENFEEKLSGIVFKDKEEISAVQNVFTAELFRCTDMLGILNALVLQKKTQFKDLSRTQILLVAPPTGPEGFGIQTEAGELKQVLAQLIDESVGSLGMQTGFVRLNVQFTLRQMLLIIEDNGRGLGKDALLRLKAKGLQNAQETHPAQAAVLAPLEMRSLLKFWGADFEIATRLGVGRRVCMSFPLASLAAEEMIRPFEGFKKYASGEANLSH